MAPDISETLSTAFAAPAGGDSRSPATALLTIGGFFFNCQGMILRRPG